MRHLVRRAETETIEVRRLSDGATCVIEKGEMDSLLYEPVRPVIPSAGKTTIEEQVKKRVRG
jgi:hypothetical protein